jgi:hypothetical protein
MTDMVAWAIVPHNDKRYQVIWVFSKETGRPIRISICLLDGATDLDEDIENITPSNIVSKLPTILTFS